MKWVTLLHVIVVDLRSHLNIYFVSVPVATPTAWSFWTLLNYPPHLKIFKIKFYIYAPQTLKCVLDFFGDCWQSCYFFVGWMMQKQQTCVNSALSEFHRLFCSANVTLKVDTSEAQGFLMEAQVLFHWPKLSTKNVLKFPVTQVGNLTVSIGVPMMLQPFLFSVCRLWAMGMTWATLQLLTGKYGWSSVNIASQ